MKGSVRKRKRRGSDEDEVRGISKMQKERKMYKGRNKR